MGSITRRCELLLLVAFWYAVGLSSQVRAEVFIAPHEDRDIPPSAVVDAAAGRFDLAIPAYRQRAAANPTNAESRLNLAAILGAAGQRDEALAELRKAIRVAPSNASAHNALGIFLTDSGNLVEGIAELRQAITLQPKVPKYVHDLGVAYATDGQLAEAEKRFKQCLELDPNYAEGLDDLGLLQMHTGQFAAAAETLTASITVTESRKARLGRAVANIRSEKGYRAAIDDCNFLLAQNPADDEALSYRAFANMRCGFLEAAVRDAEQSIALSKDSNDIAHVVLGCIVSNRGDIDLASEHFTKALKIRADTPLPFVLRALCHFQKSAIDDCVADLDAAIQTSNGAKALNVKLDGYGWQVYRFRGLIKLFAKSDFQGAIDDLTEAISLKEKDADSIALRSWANCALGNWKGASLDADRALSVDSGHELATMLMLQILTACPTAESRDPNRARRLAELACSKTDWKNAAFIEYLAAAYSNVDDFEKATTTQERAIARIAESNVHSMRVQIWWSLTTDINIASSKDDANGMLELYRARKPYHASSIPIAFTFNQLPVRK